MPCVGVRPLPQPVTRRTTDPDTYHCQTGQTTQYLSTGKGHELNYLTYLPQAQGPQKANTIHPQL
ncbi:hypothetical protein D3C85_1661900 [compost metagenome]